MLLKFKLWQIFEIAEMCKGVHCVDLGESFQTHIYLQNLASIQPRASPLKFARSSGRGGGRRGRRDRRGEGVLGAVGWELRTQVDLAVDGPMVWL